MAGHKRMANYELLRVLAMAMVVAMHFLTYSDRLPVPDEPLGGIRVLGALLEAFCLVAVNVYVFISGYFGVKSTFKPSKAVGLLCQIWFYALLIPLALTAAGIPTVASRQGIYGLIQYLFPVETEHYWFATAYFVLYLLTPVLNLAVRHVSKRQLQIILGGLLILYCGIKSVIPVAFVFDRYGYDLQWFICVYLLAAYFSLYGGGILEKKGWLIYVASCLAGFGANVVMWSLSGKGDWLRYYFTVPYHYNYIFCLTGAVGLFYGFSGVRIKEGSWSDIIRKLGSLCFGVYLFHEHIDLRALWYGVIRQVVNPQAVEGVFWFFWELICCMAILFAAGIIIDWIRSRLYSLAAKALGRTKAGKWLCSLDGCFMKEMTTAEDGMGD